MHLLRSSMAAWLRARFLLSGVLGPKGIGGESGGSKGAMKVGGVKEISPNMVESTLGIL